MHIRRIQQFGSPGNVLFDSHHTIFPSSLSFMLSIRRSEVPEYLQQGGFFAGLDPNDDEAFEVPSDCFKPNIELASQSELSCLLHTLQFWSVNTLPMSVLEFVMTKHQEYKWSLFLLDHRPWRSILFSYLQIAHLPAENRISQAIESPLGVNAVQWLHENGCDLHSHDYIAAARVNDLPSFRYLHVNGCVWDTFTFAATIQHGSIECFTYAVEQCCESNHYPNWLEYAVQTGSARMIKHMHTLGNELHPYHVDFAIKFNQVSSLRALHELGVPLDKHSILSTCTLENDAVECLQYLVELGCPWGNLKRTYCDYATRSLEDRPSLRCFRYAYMHGCTLTISDLQHAAERGDVECLQYAHEHGVEWDVTVFRGAMIFRSTWACRWYVLSRGCPARAVFPLVNFSMLFWLTLFWERLSLFCMFVAIVSTYIGQTTMDEPHALKEVISMRVRDALRVVFTTTDNVVTLYLWCTIAYTVSNYEENFIFAN